MFCKLVLAVILAVIPSALAGNNGDSGSDMSLYSQSTYQEWLYSFGSLEIVYHGCVWSEVYGGANDGGDKDEENGSGCLQNSSEDGTYYWYQMANCKRANVAFSVYGTEASSSGSCSNKRYLETFVTKSGLVDFVDILSNYGNNPPITYNDVYNLPTCAEDGNGYYQAVGCSSSGEFTIDLFDDAYCNSYVKTYDTLSSVNYKLSSLKNCYNCYSSSSGKSPYNSLCANVVPDSDTCSPLESDLCSDVSGRKTADYKSKSGTSSRSTSGSASSTILTKVKYTLGFIFLGSSLVMFMGILYTNRRKRRALMHRKFRQSSGKNRGVGSSRRSASRSRGASRGRSARGASSGRSSSRGTEGFGTYA
uniref:Uncharacterized protein n=1 Tax=Corethron hystrix TaxID=216773 RepID=A0A7S1FTP3_9STRA|mmetsp:Transcript_30205/g.69237  ORF Transcript_30205/g.69237 Transcript_30205/m.69237 type:complete len:363 (+) Transcript_30205:418-1506(+)